MKTLIGKLTSNGNLIRELHKKFSEDLDFFIAYVDMCYDFDIDVPFWTTVQEKTLERKGMVVFEVGENKKLTLTIVDSNDAMHDISNTNSIRNSIKPQSEASYE